MSAKEPFNQLLGATAFWTASVRANESSREDRLFDDPWTATLTQAGQPDANLGRWNLPVIPTKMPDMPHNWFVTATF